MQVRNLGQHRNTPHQLLAEASHINVMIEISSVTHVQQQIARWRRAPTLLWLWSDNAEGGNITAAETFTSHLVFFTQKGIIS